MIWGQVCWSIAGDRSRRPPPTANEPLLELDLTCWPLGDSGIASAPAENYRGGGGSTDAFGNGDAG